MRLDVRMGAREFSGVWWWVLMLGDGSETFGKVGERFGSIGGLKGEDENLCRIWSPPTGLEKSSNRLGIAENSGSSRPPPNRSGEILQPVGALFFADSDPDRDTL